MKKRKTTEGIICPKCGSGIEPSATVCPVCGEAAPAPEAGNAPEKKPSDGVRAVFSAILGLLLAVFELFCVLLLFVHALNENVQIPSIGAISGDSLTVFLDSWCSVALGVVLALLPVLILVLINLHRIRRCFLSVGVSTIAAAVLCVVLGFIVTTVIKALPAEWQNTLVNTTVVFKDFSVVCAVILIAVGAACLSVYSCIAVIKGDKHEKNA